MGAEAEHPTSESHVEAGIGVEGGVRFLSVVTGSSRFSVVSSFPLLHTPYTKVMTILGISPHTPSLLTLTVLLTLLMLAMTCSSISLLMPRLTP